jgi:A/G-specific adenine glycosylase
MARHESEPILDGNLIRIFSRLYLWNFLPVSKAEKDLYWKEAASWSGKKNGYIINEALMELGRTVCKVQTPLCGSCPLRHQCRACNENQIAAFPPRRKNIQETWHGVILVIESADAEILSIQEDDTPFLKGQRGLPLFEFSKAYSKGFPGKAERWVAPESVERYQWCGAIRHAITKYKIECQVLYIRLKIKSTDNFQWITRTRVKKAFANSLNLKALQKALGE